MSRLMPLLKRWLMIILRVVCRISRGDADSSFLIPAYTGLGNFILMSPMVSKLRQLYPTSTIYVLAGNSYGSENVFQGGDGIVSEVLLLPERKSFFTKLAFFHKLRKKKIQTTFVPFDAAPAFYRWGIVIAGIPRSVGHTLDVLGQPMNWTRDVLTDPVPLRLDTHESDLHFDLLEAIHGPFVREYKTYVAASPETAIVRFGLTPSSYIAVQVSAANAGVTPKRWTDAGFADLIKRFNRAGETVVLLGDQNERMMIDAFVARYKIAASNLAGMTSVAEVSAIISHARLLVCHDSGLMHIGNAHKTPLVALYGPTDLTFTAPRASTSRVMRSTLPCIPCMKNFAKTESEALRDCPFNVQCMRDLSVDEVYRACLELL